MLCAQCASETKKKDDPVSCLNHSTTLLANHCHSMFGPHGTAFKPGLPQTHSCQLPQGEFQELDISDSEP